MASSQVEIASNSPFDYILKDRNRHDRFRTRDSNAFQKNFKDLVQTHLNSCISSHSRNPSSGFIDYTDLWVHNPQRVNNENEIHSQNSGDTSMPGHSDFNNENSHRQIDHTDLRVHNPQRNNNENNPKKNKAVEKWDKAREMVFAFERKIQEALSGAVSSTSQKFRNRDGASSGPPLTSQKGKDPDNPSSGTVSNSQGGKIIDDSSLGSVSTSLRGRTQEVTSTGAISIPKRERSPEGSSSGPVSTSQRGRNWEVVSSRLFPLSQRGKNQEGMSSGHDLRYQRENSPVKSETSEEVRSSLGVSSLLQKWRGFEAEAKSVGVANSPVCTFKSNSMLFFADNESFADAPAEGSDACEDFVDLTPATPTKNEELFLDWESDQTGLSGPPSTGGIDSDVTENEKIRVADIIKKLTSNGEYHIDREPTVIHESLPRVRTSVDKSEQRSFSSVSSSPRIRGRQAFNDLLTQMERDRQNELERLVNKKAVSKFSHRGRIQSMLRVKLLRRGAEEKDDRRTISISSESSRPAQSAIVHIRQRFNEGVQHNETDSRNQQREEMVDKSPQGKKFSLICQRTNENHQQGLTEATKPLNALDNNLDAEKTIRTNPVVDFNHQETNTMVQQNGLQEKGSEILQGETDSSSDVIQQGTKSESSNHNMPELVVKETSVKNTKRNEHLQLEGSNKKQHIGSSNEFMNVTAKAQGDEMEKEEETHQNLVDGDCSQETDFSHPLSEWEELQDYYEQQVETNQDWITDVSRPRSTWEDLRQARYQEMLDPFMKNDDIRQLLESKSVSSFLSSGLRESIDRLMMSRAQQPLNPLVSRIKVEERTHQVEEVEKANKVEMEEERKELEAEEQEEQEEQRLEYSNDYEKDEEDEIQIEKERNESQDYSAQATSWDLNQDQGDSGNYFDPPSFPSPQESQIYNSSSSETQPRSSFTNHPSIEMEFMYEMRGNMEQLHQEISVLRRSIKSCINMQMKLQKSITQEAISGSCHSGRKKRRDSTLGKKSSKGRCYICYEMQIDSLLYRCGHMCTCFKCAQDLQWSSGTCPICQAPIIDVVRAYACS